MPGTSRSCPTHWPGRSEDAPSQLVEVGGTRPRRVDRVPERRTRKRPVRRVSRDWRGRANDSPDRRTTTTGPTRATDRCRGDASPTCHEPAEPRVLEDAGAERVDDAHRAGATGVGESGNAERRIGAQLQRVAEAGVDASQDHVHRHPAADGAQPDATVPRLRSPTPGPVGSRAARPSTRARRRFPTANPATGSRSTGRRRRLARRRAVPTAAPR